MKRAILLASALGVAVAGCTATTDEPGEVAEHEFEYRLSPPPPPPPASADYVTVTGARLAGAPAPMVSPRPWPQPEPEDRERYDNTDANPVVSTAEEPVSTFSIDVDTASYAVVRDYLIDSRELPPSDAVRIEEMINYFDYDYALPPGPDEPFATHVTVTPNPWNENTQLMHVGIQGFEIVPDERPRANLVFLVDVSGSMNAPDKLPLAVQAMHMLVDELEPEDTVSLVVYAGAAGAVLEPTEARNARRIHEALDRLHAGGSTAGGAGLELAYSLARRNFDEDAVNRVMLLTDGDFNVGVTRDESLEDYVARQRDSGIYLSVMGFGRGNYNDRMMQLIAQAGNGTAGYIDSRQEARRMLVEESFSSLFPIANDVKIQVEFNPARVAEYRLIGYETRLLDRADFNNDAVDAGEVGSGHAVTAIYEIAAPGSEGVLMDSLRYGGAARPAADLSGEYGLLRLRYKEPGEDESILMERTVTDADAVRTFGEADTEVRFSVAVAGFAQLLRGAPYLQDGYSWEAVAEDAASALGEDEFGYRAEFLELVERARRIDEGTGLKE
ncbi:VWA domain-containing protein [Maricaulis sp.]|uniref:vWA domain-containing protein n=1 Tax=Maricaulis sp. TaxID=1486257 RepID=UPI001AFDE871|nr:VWA domain-containing protein [Maricaulis sp.]MBO6765383.1 VWA domain-containing protein [Maricaulis sp.]